MTVAKLKFDISMSLDGYIAGPDAGREHPLGKGGEALHEWAYDLRSFNETHGRAAQGETGADDDVLAEASTSYGAAIMGKRMFCGEDGPWGGEPFEGWWGDEPPFKAPVFVLTNHAREALEKGDTRFEFVTDGIESALERARDAAGEDDVQISGGAKVAQQYLAAGLLDEIQIHIVPILLGGGTRLFAVSVTALKRMEITRTVEGANVTHVRYETRR
ncbi:MAG: dihydrofolate reductase family protein [Solirubrobacterales bacterium]